METLNLNPRVPAGDGSGEHSQTPGVDPNTDNQNPYEVVDKFEDMKLKVKLLDGIKAMGYEKPLAAQQKAIIPCVNGHNVNLQAPPRAGKTASVCISILERIDTSLRGCQALIIQHGRVQAEQVSKYLSTGRL